MPYFEEIKTLGDIARYHAKKNADQIAFVCKGRELTYAEFNEHTNQVANGLIAQGFAAQSRIAVMDKNTEWFFELALGAAKADMPLVGINWRLAAPELFYVLQNAEAEILFVGEEFLPLIEQIKADLPLLKTTVLMAEKSEGLTSYVAWRDQASKEDPLIGIPDRNVCIQMYTSGTTGHPKGVMLSHRNILSAHKINCEMDADEAWNRWGSNDVSLVAMPNFHIGGSNWGFTGLYAGAKNVVLPEFIPAEVLRCFREYQITKLFMVPAAMQLVLADPACAETDFSSIEYILYGASPIPLTLLSACIDTFQCGFVQLYGMTEGAAMGTYLPPEDHDPKGNERMKGAGKARPGVEVSIKNDNGQDLPLGEIGEICLKTKGNMVGYWKNPQATAETFIGDWLKTGDAGYMDADGYIYVQDRIKDMIVSGGENIYPAEIESVLFAHESIADVAVIGVPDEKWGEAVKAVVVLKNSEALTEQSLIDFVEGKIAKFKLPKTVDFVDVLPRNPSGKLLKRELREPYWQGKSRRVN